MPPQGADGEAARVAPSCVRRSELRAARVARYSLKFALPGYAGLPTARPFSHLAHFRNGRLRRCHRDRHRSSGTTALVASSDSTICTARATGHAVLPEDDEPGIDW